MLGVRCILGFGKLRTKSVNVGKHHTFNMIGEYRMISLAVVTMTTANGRHPMLSGRNPIIADAFRSSPT